MAHTRQELDALIEKYQLSAQRQKIIAGASESVRLLPTASSDSEIRPGTSKIGGQPDLPPALSWPRRNDGTPLAFLAQINLKEAKVHAAETALPDEGLLSFFYDSIHMPYGSLKHADGFSVLYSPSTENLARTAPAKQPAKRSILGRIFGAGPAEVPQEFAACKLTFTRELTLPDFEALQLQPDTLVDNYIEMVGEFNDDLPGGYGATRMFGHPDAVQGEVREECAQTLGGSASAWLLLLQVDSVSEAKMMWGDAGMLYFLIKREDLARRDFSKVHQIMQCC